MIFKKRKLKKGLAIIMERVLEETKEDRNNLKNYIEKFEEKSQLIAVYTLISDLISGFTQKEAKELIKQLNTINLEVLCEDE